MLTEFCHEISVFTCCWEGTAVLSGIEHKGWHNADSAWMGPARRVIALAKLTVHLARFTRAHIFGPGQAIYIFLNFLILQDFHNKSVRNSSLPFTLKACSIIHTSFLWRQELAGRPLFVSCLSICFPHDIFNITILSLSRGSHSLTGLKKKILSPTFWPLRKFFWSAAILAFPVFAVWHEGKKYSFLSFLCPALLSFGF